ncbi:MAG: helix-turn-helix transcriptional regulator [Mediterranea sp.]|jgi:hypothetical protein|nr:helix-turn-helix transcriptional regulator [Mediterranea sp.]
MSDNEPVYLSEEMHKMLTALVRIQGRCVYVINLARNELCFIGEQACIWKKAVHSEDGELRTMDYMKSIIHADDFEKFQKYAVVMYHTIRHYSQDLLSHFSFNLRMGTSHAPYHVHFKVLPHILNEHPEVLVYIVSPATSHAPEQFTLYEKKDRICRSYKNDRWNERWKRAVITRRQQDIILHAKCGRSYKEIASILSCSERTVRNLTARLYKKLGVYSMIESIRTVENYELMND